MRFRIEQRPFYFFRLTIVIGMIKFQGCWMVESTPLFLALPEISIRTTYSEYLGFIEYYCFCPAHGRIVLFLPKRLEPFKESSDRYGGGYHLRSGT